MRLTGAAQGKWVCGFLLGCSTCLHRFAREFLIEPGLLFVFSNLMFGLKFMRKEDTNIFYRLSDFIIDQIMRWVRDGIGLICKMKSVISHNANDENA